MKKTIYIFLSLLMLASCAKTETLSTNQKNKRFFDAWVSQMFRQPEELEPYGPYMEKSGDNPGAGDPVDDSLFVRVRYTAWNVNGGIVASSEERMHRQLGDYDTTFYYGPVIWSTKDAAATIAGLRMSFDDMHIGGKRKIAIPGWLNMLEDHNHAVDYFNSKTEPGDIRLYEYEILDATRDITRWCVDSVARFVAAHPACPYAKSAADVPSEDARFVRCGAETKDTTALGFWYQSLKNPTVEKYMPVDTTVLVNYVGRLLNGQVFDTNIKDTAKKYDPKWSSKTYSPMKIKFGKDYTDLRAVSSNNTESSLIRGFTYAVRHMGPDEWGVALFHQGMGYAGTAADKIPAYCPLMFELRLVKQ